MDFFNGLAKFMDALTNNILKEDARGNRKLTDEQREKFKRYQRNRRNCSRCGTAIYHNDKSTNLCIKCQKELEK